jgi:hypothetical protein
MKINQENRFSMMLTVEGICNKFNSIWSGVVAFADAFDEFTASNRKLEKIIQKQQTRIKGTTEDKFNKKMYLIKKTLMISRAMTAFANVTHNEILREEINFSERELIRCRDTELDVKCKIVQDRAVTYQAELTIYGLTPVIIAAQATAIDDYYSVVSKPRVAIAVRKSQTENLEKSLDENMKLLTGRLDNLTEIFSETHPEFVSEYKNSRIIVDLGVRKQTFSGKVKAGKIKNILPSGFNDLTIFTLKNKGEADLKFCTGANGKDVSSEGIKLKAGEIIEVDALSIGKTGNHFLNVISLDEEKEGKYSVVRGKKN